MIQIKREFNNGIFDCLEIYDNEFKILEKTNGFLWNTNERHIIVVVKSRLTDYEESTTPVDLEKLKKLDELEKIEENTNTNK